jgi:dipeptidyl aminopeptidase/acylaminoacyl peptidase
VVDIASGRATRLTPALPRASVRLARFAAAGRTVLVATDREDEHVTLLALDRATGAWRALTRGLAANVEGLAVLPDGHTAVVALNVAGVSELHRLDLRTGARRPLPGIPEGVISGLRAARAAPVIGFTVSAATAPPDACAYDLAAERLSRLTHAERAGLPEPTLVRPEVIAVPSFDGLRVPALVYRPRRPGPHPVLIWLHGGPEAQARPAWSALLQHLVTGVGIAVIQPNVRGSDGYGKTYLALDDGVRREGAIRDVGAVLDHVARQPDLDARRVAVLGGSYGGYLALASLVAHGRRIRAGVDVVGISDLATFLGRTAAYRRDLRRAEYGDERDPAVRAVLDRISPLRQAHRIRSALLVAQGANDPRVPRAESEQIVRAVRRAGGEVWYLLAHREGHGFRRQASRDQLHALTVLFLARHLVGPGEGPRP